MSTGTKTVAFFGATGDCAGYCLAATLKAGYTCTALARTPAKLIKSLKDKNVPEETLNDRLTIIQGDAKDVEAVKKVLVCKRGIVDTILSGLGGVPVLQWSLWQPVTLTDPTICQDAGKTILDAASQLAQEMPEAQKPLFINISTTGISPADLPRDVPILFVPLYHWFLAVPHADKRVLEQNLREHMHLPEGQRGLRGYVSVKPSLMMDGNGKGVTSVREGVSAKPAVGYTIQRKDVGDWIFEKLVSPETVRSAWREENVSITY